MSEISRRIGVLMGIAALALVLSGATPSVAQSTPPALACGRVVAYTPPTATAAGSITLGTTTFALKAGSLEDPPAPIAVGAIVCLDENQAGEILARMIQVGDTICGVLTATTPTSITLQGNRSRIIAVRQGASVSGAQVGTEQCFTFGFNAAGDPEITGRVAGAQQPAPAASPRQLPSTSTATGIWEAVR